MMINDLMKMRWSFFILIVTENVDTGRFLMKQVMLAT